jgi:hypothetical protein
MRPWRSGIVTRRRPVRPAVYSVVPEMVMPEKPMLVGKVIYIRPFASQASPSGLLWP